MMRVIGVIFGLLFVLLAVLYLPTVMAILVGVGGGAFLVLFSIMLVCAWRERRNRQRGIVASSRPLQPEDLMMTKAGRESFKDGRYVRKPGEPISPVEAWLWRKFGR